MSLSVNSAKSSKPLFLCEETVWTSRMNKLSPRLRELVTMHTYARPSRSQTEEAFIADYIQPLKGAYQDGFGNWIVQVGKGAHSVMWTSHTDTVAWYEGQQAVCIDKDGDLALDLDSEASCLGADCTVGVWLMRRMILAGKPGLYVFHREEETGGNGSSWIVENTPELVSGVQFCISLDRRGYSSIITDQIYGETASNEFAASMASQLQGSFKADPGGTFTDSAFYSGLIPECSNLSVGYFSAHSSKECLDYEFADSLLLKLLALDYSKLVASRIPEPIGASDYGYGRYTSPYGLYQREQWGDGLYSDDDYVDGEEEVSLPITTDPKLADYVDRELLNLVSRNPEAVTLLLQQWDLSTDDLYKAIREIKSYV